MATTIPELARITGIPVRTLEHWRTKGIVPPNGSTLAECVQQIIEMYKEKAESAKGNDEKKDRLYEAQVAETEAKALKLNLANEVMQGNLMVADQAMDKWAQYVGTCRAKLLALPSRLASECAEQPALKLQALATDIIYEALTELAQGLNGSDSNPDRD
jgi:DNA-binding transcriptional MerR regulator